MDYADVHKEGVELEQYFPPTSNSTEVGNPLHRIWRGMMCYLPFLQDLKQRLKQRKYDVVHFSTSASLSLLRDILTIKIAHKFGVKTVAHFHFGRIPQIYEARNWEYRLIDQVIRMADIAVVMDAASFETLKTAGYENVTLIPNPLSPNIAECIEENKSIAREPRKILFAGHVIPTKGVHELVAACKEIPDIKLQIYGRVTDEMRMTLIAEAGESHSKWLEIMGECQSESVIKAMLSASAFVLPTYTEGFPNVIIESMACGCPIVTTPVGAIPEMLGINGPDKCGICVPPRNVEKLREAIILMIEKEDYAMQCGHNAQKRVNELYAMNKVWDKLQTIWQNI